MREDTDPQNSNSTKSSPLKDQKAASSAKY